MAGGKESKQDKVIGLVEECGGCCDGEVDSFEDNDETDVFAEAGFDYDELEFTSMIVSFSIPFHQDK